MSEERAASDEAAPGTEAAAARPGLLNREQAILAFNRRVLAQAERADVPLLERLRYITIVSSNGEIVSPCCASTLMSYLRFWPIFKMPGSTSSGFNRAIASAKGI